MKIISRDLNTNHYPYLVETGYSIYTYNEWESAIRWCRDVFGHESQSAVSTDKIWLMEFCAIRFQKEEDRTVFLLRWS